MVESYHAEGVSRTPDGSAGPMRPPPETSQAIATCVDTGTTRSGAGVADSRCCAGRHRLRAGARLALPRAMKKVPFKKLALTAETIRNLTAAEMQGVDG